MAAVAVLLLVVVEIWGDTHKCENIGRFRLFYVVALLCSNSEITVICLFNRVEAYIVILENFTNECYNSPKQKYHWLSPK
jgi:hypothetical protein